MLRDSEPVFTVHSVEWLLVCLTGKAKRLCIRHDHHAASFRKMD